MMPLIVRCKFRYTTCNPSNFYDDIPKGGIIVCVNAIFVLSILKKSRQHNKWEIFSLTTIVLNNQPSNISIRKESLHHQIFLLEDLEYFPLNDTIFESLFYTDGMNVAFGMKKGQAHAGLFLFLKNRKFAKYSKLV